MLGATIRYQIDIMIKSFPATIQLLKCSKVELKIKRDFKVFCWCWQM